jgi:hypothetical protein
MVKSKWHQSVYGGVQVDYLDVNDTSIPDLVAMDIVTVLSIPGDELLGKEEQTEEGTGIIYFRKKDLTHFWNNETDIHFTISGVTYVTEYTAEKLAMFLLLMT